MPYQNGKYVAPKWSNNAPPPINASELQAIADKCQDTFDKDETLSSSTAAIYGVSGDYTPDKVFQAISANFNRVINVTVTLDGSPIRGVVVSGISPESGEGQCITDSSGKTSGVSGVDSVTLTTKSGYVDVNEVNQVVNTGGALSTDVTLAITSKSTGKVEVKTSQTIKFTPKRTSVTYFIVGGGASGAACKYQLGAAGGYFIGGSSGGNVKTGTINLGNQQVEITVGAGGIAKNCNATSSSTPREERGSYGGTTIIKGAFGELSAVGGNPGQYDYENINRNHYSYGGSGGSGGGGASNVSAAILYVGNGGYNGSDGYSDGSNLQLPNGQKVGGSGSGNTTFDGVVYAPGAGGITKSSAETKIGVPGTGAGTGLFAGSSGTAGSATTPGGAGGSVFSVSTYANITSGAGADGIAIFKW